LAGVRVYLEGTTLHLASSDLLVGDACSGFSTLYAALAVACLVAYSAASNFRRALVFLAVAPAAIAANIARVLLLVLLVAWRGEAVLATPLHLAPPAPAPAPGLGEHTREVLAEVGLGEAEIDALVP
jgi:exosortase/archaeosortase family protein